MAIICILLLSGVASLAARYTGPGPVMPQPGPFCGITGECCRNRQDSCAHKISEDSLCYCDEYCYLNRNHDCCPDYVPVCRNESLPLPPQTFTDPRRHRGKRFLPAQTTNEICNTCTDRMDRNCIVNSRGTFLQNARGNCIVNANYNSIVTANHNILATSNNNGIVNGNGNSIENGNRNSIVTANHNRLVNSNYNKIVNGNGNIIQNGNRNSIISGDRNRITNTNDYAIVSGDGFVVVNGNVVNGNGIVSVNGNDFVIEDGIATGCSTVNGNGTII